MKLCEKCKKPIDRYGYYCKECLVKYNHSVQETRQYYKKIHIFPVCRKNKIFDSESSCPECKAAKSIYNSNYYESNKEACKRTFKAYNHKIYKERADQGICTRCGKRKAAPNRKKCYVCLEIDAQRHRNKKDRIAR